MSDAPQTRRAYLATGKCIGGTRYVAESEMFRIEMRLNARETAKDLLLQSQFDAIHQMRPYYAELAAKDGREHMVKVHDGNLKQTDNALKAFEQYRKEME